MSLADRLSGMVSTAASVRRAAALALQGKHDRAFPLFAGAARTGLAEAQYRVGRCYLEGAGVPVSRPEGVRWLKRAALQEHMEAQSLLAAMYIHGVAGPDEATAGTAPASVFAGARPASALFSGDAHNPPDLDSAAHWARKAADAGSADGQALLAYILTSGPEAMRDLDAAEALYEKSAAAGCPQGALGYGLALLRRVGSAADVPALQQKAAEQMAVAAKALLPTGLYLMGVMAERGIGMQPDASAAVQHYRQGAERGLSQAQARLGLALMEGRGTRRDTVQGESWLRRAALGGDPEAAALVGDLYSKGADSLPPNYAEAGMWYRRAAEAGHAAAARALGLFYLTGAGVPRDPEEAAAWFRRSVEAGDRLAAADLANLVLAGKADPGDARRTRDQFEEAAAAGDLVAAFNFGVCLAEGVGIERDDAQATVWLRRAADGVVNAQYWYGRMLVEGRGGTLDPAEGRSWIARAADVGMVDAQVLLAEMMVNARGGPRDHAGALELFQRAAAQGHVGAMFALGALNGGGHDVPVDRVVAMPWFRAAAERNHIHAQLMLGRYLARGLAGPADPVEAQIWLSRALAAGLLEAQPDLAALHPPAAPSLFQVAEPHAARV